MSDAPPADALPPPPASVGERLRLAREAKGLSLDEVGNRTRVPLRHLVAIEAGDYAALPTTTYAVGFVKAYARVVGEDEVVLSRDVREEVSRTVRPAQPYQPYEMADPARVPSRGVAIVAAGLFIAVLVLAILYFATGLFRAGSRATSADPLVAAVPSVAPATPAAAPVPTGGQVTLTATDEVWMRVYDAANTTLYLGTLQPGEKFDVPANANGPMINVGRPDKLAVTLNGAAVPPLGSGERAIKDVPVGGAAIAARLAGTPPEAAAPSAAPAPVRAVRTSPRTTERAAERARPRASDLVRPSDDRETARANRRSPEPEATATVSPARSGD